MDVIVLVKGTKLNNPMVKKSRFLSNGEWNEYIFPIHNHLVWSIIPWYKLLKIILSAVKDLGKYRSKIQN